MTEEVKNEVNEQNTEVSPVEQRALELGWRPKEEWDGPEEEFIDAKEFVRRQPLFEKIEAQSKALKKLTQGQEALTAHLAKVREVEYQRALKTLQEARKQAIIDGEGEQVVALEERIEAVKAEQTQAVAEIKQTVQELPEEAQQWLNANKWYETDRAMKAVADSISQEYRQKVMAGDMTPAQVLEIMTREVKKEFPHKFRNPAQNRAPAVEPGSRGGATPSGDGTPKGMSEEDVQVMKKILRVTPSLSKDEYIKQWKAINGV